MKCICGYEHESGLDDGGDWNDNLKGDEEFILIKGVTFYKRTGIVSLEKKIYLKACPKCHTVKISDYK